LIKSDLVLALADMGYCKEQANVVIGDIFRIISEALTRDERVVIRGFGAFDVRTRKGHLICDARTRKNKMMDDYRVIGFRPGNSLKEAVKTGDPSKLRIPTKTEPEAV